MAQGRTAEDLMNRAAHEIVLRIEHGFKEVAIAKEVFILAGKGNNGGDGYTVGISLLKKGFVVTALDLFPEQKKSDLCAKKKSEFEKAGGRFATQIPHRGVIVDAIFGSGFQGTVTMPTHIQEVIKQVNAQRLPVLSIDVPSGLDAATGHATVAIQAKITIAIEFPKIGFFLRQGINHVGQMLLAPIGLESQKKAEFVCLEHADAVQYVPRIIRDRHKYEAGHVVGIAGSSGMVGAAIMASTAAIKSGAGIVHLVHDAAISAEFGGCPWEIVRIPTSQDALQRPKELIAKCSSVFIGPGAGTSPLMEALWDVYTHKPLVIDADGLQLYDKKRHDAPPTNAILTPHRGEMAKLLHKPTPKEMTEEFIAEVKQFSTQNNVHIILKGAATFIFSPNYPTTIMPYSDPGMATAGSGDVLTGIVASLLAQGTPTHHAALLGTYLHGTAGLIAANDETPYCLTATSLIKYLPQSFRHVL